MVIRYLLLMVAAAVVAIPAAAAEANDCSGPVRQVLVLKPLIGVAADAGKRRDLGAVNRLLPLLEKELSTLPESPVEPLLCEGKLHVFDKHAFTRLSAAQATTSVAGSPPPPVIYDNVIGQLAYTVGWARFEKHDLEGALAANLKGLAMLPLDHELTMEAVADLFQLKRFDEGRKLIEVTLAGDAALSGAERAELLDGKALCQMVVKDFAGARTSSMEALTYNASDANAISMLARLKGK